MIITCGLAGAMNAGLQASEVPVVSNCNFAVELLPTTWRFIDANFIFPDAANPWLTDFPEMINFDNLETGIFNADFIAVHTGDVNGSADVINLLGR